MAAEDNQSESTPLPSKSSPGEQAASRLLNPLRRPSSYPNTGMCYSKLKKLKRISEPELQIRLSNPVTLKSGVPLLPCALSNRARKRKQGLNMILKENMHFIGGLVEDYQFRIDSPFVSRVHCKIYRQAFASEDDALESQPLVFLKDISSNGTYVNRIRYTRRDEAVQIHHGDMISFALPLSHDVSFTFMYREVLKSDVSSNGVLGKRKPAEELDCEIKRVKREVGISVDDFHSLQRSNVELRKKLEDLGVTMDKLQSENRASIVHHQTVSQKLDFSETTEIMDDSSSWGEAEAEAGNWLVGISNDDDEELVKPQSEEDEEESMGSCPPEEDDDDDEDYNNFCNSKSTFKMDYRDGDSEESGEEVVSEFRERTHHIFKYITDDEREFGFDSDGLLIIESKSAIKEELLVKQQDEDEVESVATLV